MIKKLCLKYNLTSCKITEGHGTKISYSVINHLHGQAV